MTGEPLRIEPGRAHPRVHRLIDGKDATTTDALEGSAT